MVKQETTSLLWLSEVLAERREYRWNSGSIVLSLPSSSPCIGREVAGEFNVESEMNSCRGWKKKQESSDQAQVCLGSKLRGSACQVLLNSPLSQLIR